MHEALSMITGAITQPPKLSLVMNEHISVNLAWKSSFSRISGSGIALVADRWLAWDVRIYRREGKRRKNG